jgi:hypothetical protein
MQTTAPTPFEYIHCDVPPGVGLHEWRLVESRDVHPSMRLRVRRAVRLFAR